MKRFFRLSILLLAIYFFKGSVYSQTAEEWYDKGTDTDDPLLQIDYFSRAIQAGKKDNWVYYYRGYANHQAERLHAGLEDYLKAEKAEGNLDKTYLWSAMAWLYYDLKDNAKALVYSKKATDKNASNSDGWNISGWVNIEIENYPESIRCFSEYIKLDPADYYGYRCRSYAYLLGKNFDLALKDCDKGLSLNPGDDYLTERKGLALLKLGRKDEAMKIIGAKIDYRPDDPISISNIGNMFFETGDYRTAIEFHTEAITLYNKKIAIDPTYVKTHKNDIYQIYLDLGHSHYYLKEYQKALQDYGYATMMAPEKSEGWYEIGELQTFQDNPFEAVQAYEKAFAIKPDIPDGWVNLGFCYNELGEPTKAIQAYTRGIEHNPSIGLLYNNRGYTYLEQKLYDKALADLKKAIEIDPDVIMSHVSLGEYYFFTNDFESAIKKLDEAIAMKNGDIAEYSTAYFTRGMCFIAKKEFLKAEADERNALSFDPKHIKALEQLGIACYNQQKMCESYKAFRKAIDLDSGNTKRETKESQAYLAKLTNNPCTQ